MKNRQEDTPGSGGEYAWDPEKRSWERPSEPDKPIDSPEEYDDGYDEGYDEGYGDVYDEYYEGTGEPEYAGAGRRSMAVAIDVIIMFVIGLIAYYILTFILPSATLATDSTFGGKVIIPGEGRYYYNTDVEAVIRAEPIASYGFESWTGDVDSVADVTSADTTVWMDDSYSVTARFHYIPQPTLEPGETYPPTPSPTPKPTATPVDCPECPSEENPISNTSDWVMFGLGFVFFIGFWAWRGQTPGKMIMGVYIVRNDGNPITIGNTLVRYITYIVPLIPPIAFFSGRVHLALYLGLLLLSFLVVAASKDKRGIHDRIAGTMVVRLH